MALKVINLKRDNSKVLDSFISDVLIQTNENLYATDAQFIATGANKMVNFGFIPEASVKVQLQAKTRALIDGSEYQKGYDFSFSIESLQFYSMFQIEKFKNELCTINLHPLNIYIKDIYVQVSVDNTFDKDGNTKITISGKKFVKNIRDVYDPNPWGDAPAIWATTPVDFVPEVVPDTVHVNAPEGIYDLVSSRFESMRTSLDGTSGYAAGLEYLN